MPLGGQRLRSTHPCSLNLQNPKQIQRQVFLLLALRGALSRYYLAVNTFCSKTSEPRTSKMCTAQVSVLAHEVFLDVFIRVCKDT